MASALLKQPMLQGLQSRLDDLPSPFGIDLFTLVNASIFLFAFGASVRSAVLSLYRYAEQTFLVSVTVYEQDEIYKEILRWMDDFQFSKRDFLSAMAVSSSKDTLGNDAGQTEEPQGRRHPQNVKATNYKFPDITPSVKMKPFQGSRAFRFRGRWMLFKHTSPKGNEQSRFFGVVSKCQIELQCLSLSLKPIHEFLDDVRLHSREISISSTSIWRPIFQGRDMVFWKKIASRPARDISTVIMDRKKKELLLEDINEYLRPQTRRWYANHGIPYRRGYLFSGPPGTGKTSLASALAGAFGLHIYVLTLSDPNMSESQFQKLLSEVPPCSIVLLEDIDVAGLGRRPVPVAKGRASDSNEDENLPNTGTSAISLSCLLNALDGVSSQEGRILIMSTNAPESMDKALTRPGRVDLHIPFELPSQEQLCDLFLSIYNDMAPDSSKMDGTNGSAEKKDETKNHIDDKDLIITSTKEMNKLAEVFANQIPDKTFSAAEIQGFLLSYKRKPEAACENIADWVAQGGNKT